MSYNTGQNITSTEYNTFVTGNASGTPVTTATPNVGALWGTGNARYGYGQSVSSIAPIAVGNNVTATQWTGLLQVTNNIANHANISIASIPGSVTAGNTIAAIANLTSDISTEFGNIGNAYSLTAGTGNATSYTGTWGTTGNRRLVFTQVVDFASGDAARYFFNAGGLICLTFARSGGSSTTRNTDWTNLCTQCGTLQIGYQNTKKAGGGGAVPTIILNTGNGGYWAQTYNTAKTHFKQFDQASPYTQDYIQIDVTTSGTQGANSDLGPRVTITGYWVNAYSNVYQQTVDGTATQTLTIYTPGNAYFTTTNPWGTITYNSGASGVVSN